MNRGVTDARGDIFFLSVFPSRVWHCEDGGGARSSHNKRQRSRERHTISYYLTIMMVVERVPDIEILPPLYPTHSVTTSHYRWTNQPDHLPTKRISRQTPSIWKLTTAFLWHNFNDERWTRRERRRDSNSFEFTVGPNIVRV